MSRAIPLLLAFTGGLLLGRFAPPPILGWLGIILTRETLWGFAIAIGALMAVAALIAPAGSASRFVASLSMGGFLFVPLLFVGLVGVAAVGDQIAIAPDTLNALSVYAPAPAYPIVALYVFWRTRRDRHA